MNPDNAGTIPGVHIAPVEGRLNGWIPSGKVYNVGSTEEVSIRELAERIKIITGSSSEIVLVPYSKAYQDPGYEDVERRKPDTRRVNSLLGWSPENTLEDILGRVIHYVREQRSNTAMARS